VNRRLLTVTNEALIKEPKFTSAVEFSASQNFEAGNYVIIPATLEPNKERKFQISLFSEQATNSIKIIHIQSLPTDWKEYTVKGEWKAETAGGNVSSPSWSKNVQYLLHCSTKTTLNFSMLQVETSLAVSDNIKIHSTTPAFVGLYLFKADSTSKMVSSHECCREQKIESNTKCRRCAEDQLY
jgi:hypothetical protein